jgi:hypothetical protein
MKWGYSGDCSVDWCSPHLAGVCIQAVGFVLLGRKLASVAVEMFPHIFFKPRTNFINVVFSMRFAGIMLQQIISLFNTKKFTPVKSAALVHTHFCRSSNHTRILILKWRTVYLPFFTWDAFNCPMRAFANHVLFVHSIIAVGMNRLRLPLQMVTVAVQKWERAVHYNMKKRFTATALLKKKWSHKMRAAVFWSTTSS